MLILSICICSKILIIKYHFLGLLLIPLNLIEPSGSYLYKFEYLQNSFVFYLQDLFSLNLYRISYILSKLKE